MFCFQGDVATSEIFGQRWQDPRCQEDEKSLSKFEFVAARREDLFFLPSKHFLWFEIVDF